MSRVTRRLLGKLAEKRRRSDIPPFALVQRLPGDPPIDYDNLPAASAFLLVQDFVGDSAAIDMAETDEPQPSNPGFASRTASHGG